MKTLKIIGIVAAVIIVVIVAAALYIPYDMSNRARVTETLNANGTVVGNALVVYDPSVTDNTKSAANIIAEELQSRGYKVELAGINSTAAGNTSGYNVIVVGGPVIGGNSTKAVTSYLNTLKPAEGAKIGVFATGDTRTTDPALIRKQLASTNNSALNITAVAVISRNADKINKCKEFIAQLLQ